MMKICERTALDWSEKKGVTTISLNEVSEETFIDIPADPQVAVGNPEQQQFVTDILKSLTSAELSVIDNLEHIDRRSKKWRDLRKRLRENIEASGGLRRYYALGNDFKE